MKGTIAVVNYGMGNIHSILKALRLYHDNVVFTADPDVLTRADALVLPGDGAFAAAMKGLSGGLGAIVKDHAASGRPLLGICIGFQVLFQDSTESESGELVQGLGLLPGQIRRFRFSDEEIRIPHMGWNTLVSHNDLKDRYMYFIHSYRAEKTPADLVTAYCDYAGDLFPAVVHQKNILATQFHPEKSSDAGLDLLRRWVIDPLANF